MKILFYKTIFILLGACILSLNTVKSQCSVKNLPFQSGEYLEYDLYIKLGFVSKKGGYAKLNTTSSKYDGKDAYKMNLISETQGIARKMFELNDTLAAYTDKNLVPLAYLKNAHEGGDFTKELVKYSYGDYDNKQTIKIQTKRHKNGEFKFDEVIEAPGCTYDLVSILFYCRTLDYSNMKIDDATRVNFISGKNRGSMRIVYNGKETVKANDGKKYNTIKLTMYVADKAFDNGKEAMKVYITDDSNRIPVSLETKLKVGSTKAILTGYKGNKYQVNIEK